MTRLRPGHDYSYNTWYPRTILVDIGNMGWYDLLYELEKDSLYDRWRARGNYWLLLTGPVSESNGPCLLLAGTAATVAS